MSPVDEDDAAEDCPDAAEARVVGVEGVIT
jgi:hypothetical protein